MKTILTPLIFSIALFACNNSNEPKKDDPAKSTSSKDSTDNITSSTTGARYGIKSAKVVTVTALPNEMGNTTVTLYFDDYGIQNLTETVWNYKMKGVPPQPKQYGMTLDDYVYSWAEGEKTGTKLKMSILQNMANIDYEKLGEEMSEKMGLKKTGTETILGKTCDVYEMNNPKLGNGKILIWKNITLLTVINTAGTTVRSEVTELEENPSIEFAKLKVPADIDFKEIQMPGKSK